MQASCEYRYVPFERQTLYVFILVYQYQVCDYRAPSTSSIHSSSSANIRDIWSSNGIRSIALPYVKLTTILPSKVILDGFETKHVMG